MNTRQQNHKRLEQDNAFGKVKAKLIAHVLENQEFTPSERLVVRKRIETINSKTGAPSYWGTATIAKFLGVHVRTVHRADRKGDGVYFRIERRLGIANRFWLKPDALEQLSLVTKSAPDQCQKVHSTSDKKCTPTLKLTSKQTLPDQRPLRLLSVIDGAQAGDEKREAAVAKELGSDGYEILTALSEIDGGRPYRVLLAAVRRGLTEDDKHRARWLAAREKLARAVNGDDSDGGGGGVA